MQCLPCSNRNDKSYSWRKNLLRIRFRLTSGPLFLQKALSFFIKFSKINLQPICFILIPAQNSFYLLRNPDNIPSFNTRINFLIYFLSIDYYRSYIMDPAAIKYDLNQIFLIFFQFHLNNSRFCFIRNNYLIKILQFIIKISSFSIWVNYIKYFIFNIFYLSIILNLLNNLTFNYIT